MKPKVLLVEDEEMIRKMVQRILDNHYDVITATNGQEAYEKYRNLPESEKPDINPNDRFGYFRIRRKIQELKEDIEWSRESYLDWLSRSRFSLKAASPTCAFRSSRPRQGSWT